MLSFEHNTNQLSLKLWMAYFYQCPTEIETELVGYLSRGEGEYRYSKNCFIWHLHTHTHNFLDIKMLCL